VVLWLWLMDVEADVSFVLWSGVLGLVVCGLEPSIRLRFKEFMILTW
jgi:hypothetical protein